jgi:hypothetical protein
MSKKIKLAHVGWSQRKVQGVLSSFKTTPMGKPRKFWELPGKQ